jgi:hypothetical protein
MMLGQVPQTIRQNSACSGESLIGSAGHGLAIPNQAPIGVGSCPSALAAVMTARNVSVTTAALKIDPFLFVMAWTLLVSS